MLELVPSVEEGPARGVDGGVGVGGGVELPDLAAGVCVRRAEPGVPASLRDPQAPHLSSSNSRGARAVAEPGIMLRGGRPSQIILRGGQSKELTCKN